MDRYDESTNSFMYRSLSGQIKEVSCLHVLQFYKKIMTKQERRVYKLYYGPAHMTQRGLAIKLGVSRKRIQDILAHIKKKAMRVF